MLVSGYLNPGTGEAIVENALYTMVSLPLVYFMWGPME